MCGRVFIRSDYQTLMQNFAFADQAGALNLSNQFPKLNGAPSLDYPIIVKEEDRAGKVGPVFVSAKWGLVPSWMKPPLAPQINARSDTIKAKPMFRTAYRSRRCLVPVDGFFEWHDIYGNKKNKRPYAIALRSGKPFAMAGIFEFWRDSRTLDQTRSFAIVTCEANSMMASIHDRMPVILDAGDYDRWLSDDPDPNDLMKPYPSELMTMWPIGRKMSNARYEAGDILEEVEIEEGETPKPSGPDDPQPSLF